MRELVSLTGMVIKSTTVGEADKRLVILTRERGKVTAFARGAKRPGNMLMAPCRPFSFGQFNMYEGRDSYALQSAQISHYFEELAMDMEGTCYGSYFLEFADYYARENLDGTELLKLLYQSLRALLKPSIPNRLVRRVFELKAMVVNGEYTEHAPGQVGDSAQYAWEYVVLSPIERLYTFTLSDQALSQFAGCVEANKRQFVDREFHSLDILRELA